MSNLSYFLVPGTELGVVGKEQDNQYGIIDKEEMDGNPEADEFAYTMCVARGLGSTPEELEESLPCAFSELVPCDCNGTPLAETATTH